MKLLARYSVTHRPFRIFTAAIAVAALAGTLGFAAATPAWAATGPSVTESVPISHPINSVVHLSEPIDLTGPLVPLAKHRPAILGSSTDAGPVDYATPITLTLALTPRNRTELDTMARRVNDPSDAKYGQFYTPAQRIAEFSPTAEDFNKVAYFAQTAGLKIVDASTDRMQMRVAGTVGEIDSAFNVRLHQFVKPNGVIFHAPDVEPTVPAAIAPLIIDIENLSDAAEPQSDLVEHVLPQGYAEQSGSVLSQSVRPDSIGIYSGPGLPAGQVRNIYQLSPSYNGTTLNGSGQNVGLIEFGGFNPSNISYYINYCHYVGSPQISLRSIPLNVVPVDSYGEGINAVENEVELDIEMLEADADGIDRADIYEAGSGSMVLDVLNQIINDDADSSISMSYDIDEIDQSSADEASYVLATEQLALQGQALFVSSGDRGSQDGLPGGLNGVNAWASSQWVTGAGGTSLSLDVDIFSSTYLDYQSEAVWNNSVGATGGGVSRLVDIPDYQSIYLAEFPNSLNSPASPTMRNVPDVSLDSDPQTGYYTHLAGNDALTGGTSAAAPLWAGFWALANQGRALAGEPGLGFGNYALYLIAESSNYNRDFHDITSYNNGAFEAETGYDDATGLGSLQGANLASDLLQAPYYAMSAALSGPTDGLFNQSLTYGLSFSVPIPDGALASATLYASPTGAGLPVVLGKATIGAGQTEMYFDVTAPSSQPGAWKFYATYTLSNATQAILPPTDSNILPFTLAQNKINALATNDSTAYGDTITGTVSLVNAAAENEAIDIVSSNAAYVTVPAVVVIPKGLASVRFPIATKVGPQTVPATTEVAAIEANPDPRGDLNPSFHGQASVTVLQLINSVALSASSVIGGASASGVIDFATPVLQAQTIVLTSSTPDLIVPASIVAPAGASSVSFTVSTVMVTANIKATITATAASSKQSAVLTIAPMPPVGLSLQAAQVVAGTYIRGTVQLGAPAPVGGAIVALSSSAPTVASAPVTVTVPAGQTAAQFAITTYQVDVAAVTSITASYSRAQASQTLAVTVNAPASVSIAPSLLSSGQSAIGTITLPAPAPAGGVTVMISSNNNAAALPAYAVTIPQGMSTGTFSVIAEAADPLASDADISVTVDGIGASATIQIYGAL